MHDFLKWPREESNLRTRIRSPSLYPLSYGAMRNAVRLRQLAERAYAFGRVADGTRTHDHLDHNQGLYQLSYSHRVLRRIAAVCLD